MNDNKYDLAIAYRIYPRVSRRPPIFENNKFKLSELCIKSFKDSLGSLKVKLYVLLDNCSPKYEDLFKKYFMNEDLKLIRLKGIGNLGTFYLQLKMLTEQENAEIVYLAEDDYCYLPNQFQKMVNLLKRDPEIDFITPYDHSDYYNYPLHNYQSKVKYFSNKEWKTVSCTTCTFLTTKYTLNKTKKIFKKYSFARNHFRKKFFKKNKYLSDLFLEFFSNATDSDIWISITKINVFKLFNIIKLRIQNREIFSYYFRAWRFNWKQIMFGRKWSLWCPMPSIATHMESGFLAPNIEWKAYFKQLIDKITK